MKKYILKTKIIAALSLLTFASCNDYLDELPDNRTQIDSKVKIQKLLNSAYLSKNSYALVTEISSDNIADYGISNPNTQRILEQISYWKDITEINNDDLKNFWEECYLSIANANQALHSIEEYHGKEDLSAEKGEALVARAYLHFLLVNVFSKNYNPANSGSDLGVVYMEKPEKTLNPTYKRESVASIYEKIERDLEAGLPLINDEIYKVSKFHFTKSAAYAFAARFYLFYEKWDKAEKYADLALGNTPKLRNWEKMSALPKSAKVLSKAYFEDNSNYLLQTSTSNIGLIFGAYYTGGRFSHTQFVNDKLTFNAPMPWAPNGVESSSFHVRPSVYPATNLDKVLLHKMPYLFEYTDPVTGTGYNRSVLTPLHAEETLLVRAEARILQGKFDEGLKDIHLWTSNFYKVNTQVSIEENNQFYDNIPYASSETLSVKNKLNPAFTVSAGTQENLIHYLLHCRRILTIHEGLRWFDLKRYGIEVFRIQYDASSIPRIAESLKPNDPRRALQLPADVISAGLEANPR